MMLHAPRGRERWGGGRDSISIRRALSVRSLPPPFPSLTRARAVVMMMPTPGDAAVARLPAVRPARARRRADRAAARDRGQRDDRVGLRWRLRGPVRI